VSAEVLRAISPLAIEAAFQVIGDRERAGAERLRQSELALEQARYEVTHARIYDKRAAAAGIATRIGNHSFPRDRNHGVPEARRLARKMPRGGIPPAFLFDRVKKLAR
jgi:hypothetical protein